MCGRWAGGINVVFCALCGYQCLDLDTVWICPYQDGVLGWDITGVLLCCIRGPLKI